MDVTITISLDESQQRAIQTQLQRSGSNETIAQLVERISQKLVEGWAAQQREEFIQRNRPAVEQLVERLATDPERDEKLEPLGVRFVNGVLQPIVGSPE